MVMDPGSATSFNVKAGMVTVEPRASKCGGEKSRCLHLPIDRFKRPNYSGGMNSLEQTDQDLKRLEKQLRQLLAQIQKLREENYSLHVRQDALVNERAALVAKNDEARVKVEAMINRLKGLEQA
jgi:cell division protein ZapB